MEMKWFDMWYEDKCSIIDTMARNMMADLDAGYDPNGHCIRKQKVDLEEYRMQFDREVKHLRELDRKQVEHWCRIDMKRRGAIA